MIKKEKFQFIKERFERIMDYKKMSKKSKIAMSIAAIVLSVSAVATGAYMYTNRTSTNIQAQIQEFPQTMCVDVNVCNIRSGAGKEFHVVGLLGKGEELTILEAVKAIDEQTTWYRIDTESLSEDVYDSSVEEYYVRSDMLVRN